MKVSGNLDMWLTDEQVSLVCSVPEADLARFWAFHELTDHSAAHPGGNWSAGDAIKEY